jgi:hypothetical protein
MVDGNRNQERTPEKAPMVIFRGADGRTITMEDLRGVSGTFKYESSAR